MQRFTLSCLCKFSFFFLSCICLASFPSMNDYWGLVGGYLRINIWLFFFIFPCIALHVSQQLLSKFNNSLNKISFFFLGLNKTYNFSHDCILCNSDPFKPSCTLPKVRLSFPFSLLM